MGTNTVTKDKTILRMTAGILIAFTLTASFAGCSGNKSGLEGAKSSETTVATQVSQVETSAVTQAQTEQTSVSTSDNLQNIDLEKVKPNESGKIMIVMFHNFVETYKSGNDKAYTTTFSEFRKLLDTLYTKDYRLIGLNDFLNNSINVPAGKIPMVFTFDDGTAGQFNLIENDGKLEANPESAVGILEEFNRSHPDFGMAGTFYINLGCSVFQGKGTVKERLEYLTGKGFEVGNHTYDHVNLKKVKTAEEIQMEIGGNQKKLLEILPGYTFTSLSLPYGSPAKELKGYVEKGVYEGLEYSNKGIMEVGWDPSVPPASRKFNPLSIHRVRASGITPVEADLAWWLKQLSRQEQYVSDGNDNTVTVPKGKEALLDPSKLGSRQLITY